MGTEAKTAVDVTLHLAISVHTSVVMDGWRKKIIRAFVSKN